jgi:hypothetical protein
MPHQMSQLRNSGGQRASVPMTGFGVIQIAVSVARLRRTIFLAAMRYFMRWR